MKKIIDSLTLINSIHPDYERFREIIGSVLDIDTGEDDIPTTVSIGINGNIIRIDAETITFLDSSGDVLNIYDLLDTIKSFRQIVPFNFDEDIEDPDYEIPPPDLTPFVNFPTPPTVPPVTVAASPPSSPVNGHQWFEIGSNIPQPWEWSQVNGVWLSNTDILDFTFPHIAIGTNTALRLDLGLPNAYNKRLWLEEINFTVSARNAAFTATDFWTFSFQWYDTVNVNAHTTEWSINTQNMTQSTIRTGFQSFKKIITPSDNTRNISVLSLLGTKSGTGTGLPLPSLRVNVRYIRP